jgi:hypothetical protein
MDPNEWLSTLDVARELGMSDEWVRSEIVEHRLSARKYKTGARATWRVRRADLEIYLTEYTEEYRAAKRRSKPPAR